MGRALERIRVAEKALATLAELAFLKDPSPVERDAAIQRPFGKLSKPTFGRWRGWREQAPRGSYPLLLVPALSGSQKLHGGFLPGPPCRRKPAWGGIIRLAREVGLLEEHGGRPQPHGPL